MEFLLSVVPRFSTKTVSVYPTADPEYYHRGIVRGRRYRRRWPLYPALFHADHHQKRSGVPNAANTSTVPDLKSFGKERWERGHRRDNGEAKPFLARFPTTRPNRVAPLR